MIHHYDTSRFRAPYKNVTFLGVGAVECPSRYNEISHYRAPYKASFLGVGAVDPNAPAEIQAAEAEILKAVTTDAKGISRWKADYASLIKKLLPFQGVNVLSDRAVMISPWTPEELKFPAEYRALYGATSWVEKKLNEKNVVFATLSVLYSNVNQDKQLIAIPASEIATVRATSSMAPILAEPSPLLAMLSTPFGMALGVVAVGGVAVAVFAKKRKKAA